MEALTNNNTIEIIIKDNGKGIKDINQAMEPFYTSKPDLERSGMGFTVMETFMDELIVESSADNGTVLKMKKKINSSNVKE